MMLTEHDIASPDEHNIEVVGPADVNRSIHHRQHALEHTQHTKDVRED